MASPLLAVAVVSLFAMGTTPAMADDDPDAKPVTLPMEDPDLHRRLDHVLAVLRQDDAAAGKSCLDSMANVHADEKTVDGLSGSISDSGRKVEGLDVARDVLESDYEAAINACRPDAERSCGTRPRATCAELRGGSPR
ncbi:hypothetical protein [Rhizosaccharibacter radicis]|uniref:UrcA family protein n=1 Tax=Rhizosaccharibacter radicis TaxID=2782605 RepID=A0ABT1VWI8_9PROT|nr:hypothetical protein [Acetobacteraceae bacterium KSS12]